MTDLALRPSPLFAPSLPTRDAGLGRLAHELTDALRGEPSRLVGLLTELRALGGPQIAQVIGQLPAADRELLASVLGSRAKPTPRTPSSAAVLDMPSPLGRTLSDRTLVDRKVPDRTQLDAPTPLRNTPVDVPVIPASRKARTIDDTTVPKLERYAPGSAEQQALFREAAKLAGLPESWATSRGLQNILRRESDGVVGRPNYTYGERAQDPSQWGDIHDELKRGERTAKSSATGLGQLLLRNVDAYYPNGRAGIGDPLQEAAGMLRYIKDRYGNPDRAWRQYGKHHEGY
jgi:hypothetical protein